MQANLSGDNLLAVNQIQWNVTCDAEVFSSSDFNRDSDYWIISSLIDTVFSRKPIWMHRKPANAHFSRSLKQKSSETMSSEWDEIFEMYEFANAECFLRVWFSPQFEYKHQNL